MCEAGYFYAKRLWLFPATLLLCSESICAQMFSQNQPEDPYKSFVGQWSGKTLVDRDNLPSLVKITVTEEKNGRGMRWDYVFGEEGEKGYTRTSKLIVFDPARERMRMHFVGSPDQIYLTTNLGQVVHNGAGQFSASSCSMRGDCRICEFDLEQDSLSYRWKTTSDGKVLDIYSEFVLKREETQ